MTIEEVAEKLKVSQRTVRRWIASGRRGRVLRSTINNGRREISQEDLAYFGAVAHRTQGLRLLKHIYLSNTALAPFLSVLTAVVLTIGSACAEAQIWIPLPPLPFPPLPVPCAPCVPCIPCVQTCGVPTCAPARVTSRVPSCGKACEQTSGKSECPACWNRSCPLKKGKQSEPQKQEPVKPETPAEPAVPEKRELKLTDMMAVEDFPPLDETEDAKPVAASDDVPLLEDLEIVPVGTDEEVTACFNAINAARNRVGLKALQWDENLSKMAESHCQRMAAWGWIFHSGCGLAENVAMGHRDGLNTFMQWRNSAGHWANLCRRGTKCGLARVGIYWTFVVR